jgi:hypothetical protein
MKKLPLLLTLASLLASSAAFADEKPSTSWYGYQPLIADGVSVGLLAASLMTLKLGKLDLCLDDQNCDRDTSPPPDNTTSTALFASGAIAYAFASPTIHAIHGHWGKAGLSLGLRALPIAIGVPVAAGRDTAAAGSAILLVGALAAMVADDIFIAREPSKAPAAAFSVAPTFDAKNGGAGLAAAGTF